MLTRCIECLVTIQALSDLVYPSLRWQIERDWLQQLNRCTESNLRWVDSVYPLQEHIKPPIIMKEIVDARRYALERALAWEAALDTSGPQIGFDLEGRYQVQNSIEPQVPWNAKWSSLIVDRYAISNARRHMMAEIEMLDQLIVYYSNPANIETRPGTSYFPYIAHIRSKNGATNPEPQNIVNEVLWNRELRQTLRERLEKH